MSSNKDKYKTIRIHPEDFRYLKSMAYHKCSTIVDCVSHLINEDKKRLLKEKVEIIEVLPYINNLHKESFVEYIQNCPWETSDRGFYLSFCCVYKKLLMWLIIMSPKVFKKELSREVSLLRD